MKPTVTEKDRYSPAIVVTVFLYALIQASTNQLNILSQLLHRQISEILRHLPTLQDGHSCYQSNHFAKRDSHLTNPTHYNQYTQHHYNLCKQLHYYNAGILSQLYILRHMLFFLIVLRLYFVFSMISNLLFIKINLQKAGIMFCSILYYSVLYSYLYVCAL